MTEVSKKRSKSGKSKTKGSKSTKRKTVNPDDSFNFEEDKHVTNIVLPNVRKLGPSEDFLNLPRISAAESL